MSSSIDCGLLKISTFCFLMRFLSNDKPATWLKYKDIELEKGKWTNKMTEHHGTRAELIDEIMDKYQDWAFHRSVWLVRAPNALIAPH